MNNLGLKLLSFLEGAARSNKVIAFPGVHSTNKHRGKKMIMLSEGIEATRSKPSDEKISDLLLEITRAARASENEKTERQSQAIIANDEIAALNKLAEEAEAIHLRLPRMESLDGQNARRRLIAIKDERSKITTRLTERIARLQNVPASLSKVIGSALEIRKLLGGKI